MGITLLMYFVPPFHLVSLQDAQKKLAEADFNPSVFVDEYWHKLLVIADEKAVDINDLVAALQVGTEVAAQRYGHTLGLGSSINYFVRGTGKVASRGDTTLALELEGSPGLQLLIEVGPVFSNAVRDGSGLLNVSDFANTQDFNAISSEINRRVEAQVFPVVEKILTADSSAEDVVHFVGGIEMTDEVTPQSLSLVPVLVEQI